RFTLALTGTGIIESSLVSKPRNVCSVPTTICVSELTHSDHCRSMKRWTLNRRLALIRSTSLTHYYFESLRGSCVLLVTKSRKPGRFQRSSRMASQIRERIGWVTANRRPIENPAAIENPRDEQGSAALTSRG